MLIVMNNRRVASHLASIIAPYSRNREQFSQLSRIKCLGLEVISLDDNHPLNLKSIVIK